MNCQNTQNSIYELQEDEFILKCLVAQRKEYTNAKKYSECKMILVFAFALLSIGLSFLDNELGDALSGFFAVVLLIINKYKDACIDKHKKHAASVQQFIDVSLFSKCMNIDKKLWGKIPNKTDLAKSIKDCTSEEISDVKNWYNDYSSLKPEKQVFYSQRENIRWNIELLTSLRRTIMTFLIIFCIAISISLFRINPRIVTILARISMALPVAEYVYSVYKEIYESKKKYDEKEWLCNEIEARLENNEDGIQEKLIELQYKIYEGRVAEYMVPDWFYFMNRKKQQKQEDSIAKNINDMENK